MTKNCIAVINATFKVDNVTKHLSFYVTKSKHDYDCETEAKYNSVLSVCKMLSAVSIAVVRCSTLSFVDTSQFMERYTNEEVMKNVYKAITNGNNTNVIV